MDTVGTQLIVFLVVVGLFVLGLSGIARTKRKVKTGYLGGIAKSVGSLFSPHLDYIQEMEGMIVSEVKVKNPKDKDEETGA